MLQKREIILKMKTDKVLKVAIFILVTFIILGTPLYFSQKLLNENFYENGEAYFKGAGHLLQENFILGFCISVIDKVFWTAVISFILFVCLNIIVRRIVFRLIFAILLMTWIVVLIRYWKETLNYKGDYHAFCRSVDIISEWTSRICGLTLAFLMTNFGLSKIQNHNYPKSESKP